MPTDPRLEAVAAAIRQAHTDSYGQEQHTALAAQVIAAWDVLDGMVWQDCPNCGGKGYWTMLTGANAGCSTCGTSGKVRRRAT